MSGTLVERWLATGELDLPLPGSGRTAQSVFTAWSSPRSAVLNSNPRGVWVRMSGS